MTERTKNNTSSGERKDGNSTRKLVVWLVVVLLALSGMIAAVVAGVLLLVPQWFEKNPRMTMRRIELVSRDAMDYKGYWDGNRYELMRRLELKGATSLWQIEPEALRRKLEDPKRFSSIQSAQVHRVPPDTLRIVLTERSPVAFVGNSGLVTDENCMLIRRRESIVAGSKWDGALPVVSGILSVGRAGVRDDRLAPAVALIMEARKNTPEIRIIRIELRQRDKMLCRFRFGKSVQEYDAIFPTRHYEKNISIQLLALKASVIKARTEGYGDVDFDLSFDGQVVIKKRPEVSAGNNKKRETRR